MRAALVALHCVAIALVAAPAPSASSRVVDVSDPRFAAEVHPWATLVGLSDREFARRAERVRASWVDLRGSVVAPFERYLDVAGARQPWSLFSAPNASPVCLVLDTRPAPSPGGEAGWRFLSGLPPGEWRRGLFDSERMRSWLNTVARSGRWDEAGSICDYLGREALREDGQWAQVRCRFVSTPSPSWRPHANDGRVPQTVFERVVEGP